MTRAAIALLAIVLLTVTGMARSVSHLCLMGGQVRSTCCCNKTQAAQSDGQCPKAEPQSCCSVRVAKATSAPATTRSGLQDDHPPGPHAIATLPPTVDVPRPIRREVVVPGVGARAPPGGTRPPIFVWNCSYLI